MVDVIGVRTSILICLGALVALGACEPSATERAQAACSQLCACSVAPLPALQDRCIAQCVTEASGAITDACSDCIAAHGDQCATLRSVCEPICAPPEPPTDFVDGGV